jgi:hypothetical protein
LGVGGASIASSSSPRLELDCRTGLQNWIAELQQFLLE